MALDLRSELKMLDDRLYEWAGWVRDRRLPEVNILWKVEKFGPIR